jgi:hypothetical protein
MLLAKVANLSQSLAFGSGSLHAELSIRSGYGCSWISQLETNPSMELIIA